MADMEKTGKNLEGRGFRVHRFASGTEAAEFLVQTLHGTSIGIGGNVTIDTLGVYDRLCGSNEVFWHWKNHAPETRERAGKAETYLCSANGVSENGEIVNIEDVPDVVFAEKIVGDGIAIKPTGNKMVAPVDGTIGKIFETNHAFSIESDSGIELFVHFGIDTVELKGEGFKRIAEEGQRVKVGDPVIEFDLPLLEEKAKSTLTPVVISNMDEIKELIKLSGSVTVGETPVIRIKK